MFIFQVKRLISSEKWFNSVVSFFFSEMLKIWAGQTTLDREKKEDGLGGKGSVSPNGGGEMVPIS